MYRTNPAETEEQRVERMALAFERALAGGMTTLGYRAAIATALGIDIDRVGYRELGLQHVQFTLQGPLSFREKDDLPTVKELLLVRHRPTHLVIDFEVRG